MLRYKSGCGLLLHTTEGGTENTERKYYKYVCVYVYRLYIYIYMRVTSPTLS
jgi:hypothetical protein